EREMLAKYRAEAALVGTNKGTANDTSSKSDKSRIALQPVGGTSYQPGVRQGVAGDEVGAREVDGQRDIEDGDEGEQGTRREPPAQGDEASALRDALGPEETPPDEARSASVKGTDAVSGADNIAQPKANTDFEEKLKAAEFAKVHESTTETVKTNDPQSMGSTEVLEKSAAESARSSDPSSKVVIATNSTSIRPELVTNADSSRTRPADVVSKESPNQRIEEVDDKWLANDWRNAEDFSLRNKFSEAIEKRAKKLSGNQAKPDKKQTDKAYSTEGSRISIADDGDEPQDDSSGTVRTAVAAEPQPSAPPWRDDWSRDGGTSGSTLSDRPGESPATHLFTNANSPAAIDTNGSTTPQPTSTKELFTPAQPAKSKTLDSDRIALAQPGTTLSPAPASASSRTWESPAINSSPRSPSLGASVLIPDRAIAGKYLTVSVLAKDKQPENSVELSINGATVSTDTEGQALYLIPDDMNPGRTLHIALTDRPELSPGVVDILQPLDDASGRKAPQIDKMSPLVAIGGILVIDGHDFDGLAEKNRILIDGEFEPKIMAASPVQLRVLMPPKLVPGTHSVIIKSANSKSNSANFDFVKAEVVQPDLKKVKGALTRIVVKVQGTKQPVAIRIVNRTPDVIKMTKGDNTIATTNGGADNYYAIQVKQLKKGDIRIDASVEL
ncbi:MAG: hypothetical protein K2X93_21355, partial [Candidatus Obscuribacterales bacterium]|nr:hypothetical protein [Candidatus Obscuribacterales bacterium]